MRPIVLSVRSKAGLCLFIFSLLIAVALAATAQREERVFEQYLQYLVEKEGYNLTDAIKEIQSLNQGREEIIQSYIKTEQDLQNLEKSAFSKQSELGDYENLYPEPEFPSWEEVGDEKTNSSYSDESFSDVPFQFEKNFPLPSHSSYEETEKIPKAKFLLKDLKEFIKDGHTNLEITLENIGDSVDAIITVTSQEGVIIAKPYYRRVENFNSSRLLTFTLLKVADRLVLQIDAIDKNFKIPIFLHEDIEKPTMNVAPFNGSAKIGETAEYKITLEGGESDKNRYKLKALHLPKGITAEFLLSGTLIPVDEIKFSKAASIHKLILRLTLSHSLDPKLIGKAIPFLLALSSELVEQLTITPLGLGKIAITAPAEELLLPKNFSKKVKVTVENIGTADIPNLEIFASDAILDINAECSPKVIALSKGEAKEITITIFATSNARIGTQFITITALAKGEQALFEEVTLQVQVVEREKAFFLSSTLFNPSFLLAILVAIGIAFAIYTLKRLAKKEEFSEEVEEEIEYV